MEDITDMEVMEGDYRYNSVRLKMVGNYRVGASVFGEVFQVFHRLVC